MPKYRKNDPIPRNYQTEKTRQTGHIIYKFKNKISTLGIGYFQDLFVRIRIFGGNIKGFVFKDTMRGYCGVFSKGFKSLKRFSSNKSYKIH